MRGLLLWVGAGGEGGRERTREEEREREARLNLTRRLSFLSRFRSFLFSTQQITPLQVRPFNLYSFLPFSDQPTLSLISVPRHPRRQHQRSLLPPRLHGRLPTFLRRPTRSHTYEDRFGRGGGGGVGVEEGGRDCLKEVMRTGRDETSGRIEESEREA